MLLVVLLVAACLGLRVPGIKEGEVVLVPPKVRRVTILSVDDVDTRVLYGERATVLRYSGHRQQICEQPTQMNLVLTRDLKNLMQLLDALSSAQCWNARAKFLVVPDAERVASLESILRQAWVTLYVLNLTVLLGASAFTFHPFKGDDGALMSVTGERLFPDKARDLHGHLLIGSAFPNKPQVIRRADGSYEGPDVNVFLTLARYLNATPRLVPPSDGQTYGFRSQDGRVGGSSGDVAYGHANVTVNSSYKKTNLSDLVDFSYPQFQDDYCVVVPKAGLVPIERNFLLPFTSYTWIALLCSIPSAGMCFYLLFPNSSFSKSLLGAFKAFITGAMPRDTRTTSQRGFLIMWACCSLVLINAYQGSLTSYLVVPQNLPDIDTLQQLNSSRLSLFGVQSGRLLLSGDSPILSSLSKMYTVGIDTDETLARVAFVKDAAWLRGSIVAAYQVSRTKFIGSDGHALLHLMKQSILMKFASYEVTRGSPVLPHLNKVVQRVVVAGLYSKWTRDVEFEEILSGDLRSPQQMRLTLKSLQLKHLQCAFYILGAGLALATAIFIIEMINMFQWYQLFCYRKGNISHIETI